MAIKTDHRVIETYQQAVSFIMEALPMFQQVGRKAIDSYDLSNVDALLHYLGNPHKKFRSIHIAGTNGKGSVSHMLAAVYQENGYKTGLFTSPHLVSYRERIKINGLEIPENVVLEWVQNHYQYLTQNRLSFFEMSVGLACSWFTDQDLDIVVMETGLGGRLDATNLITPILAIITNIDYDHQNILGDTLEKISQEKAGIIKKNVPVILGNVESSLYPVFAEKARQENARLFYSDDSLIASTDDRENGILYHLKKDVFPASSICLPSMAPYHRYNLNTVLYALTELRGNVKVPLDAKSTKEGLENFTTLTRFRGRYEILHREPLIIADAAHNPGGIRFFNSLFKNNSVHLHLVLGVVKGKDLHETFSLLPGNATYYFCAANVPRAMDAHDLQQAAFKYGLHGKTWPSVKRAIEEIILNANQEDIGLIIGSIYLLEEIL